MADRPNPTVLHLVVTSPDGSRVLARPNGLSAWSLPVMTAVLPVDTWTDELLARAAAAVGGPLRPIEALDDDAWVMAPADRIPAVGTTWIGADDVGRLGSDAARARAWFDR